MQDMDQYRKTAERDARDARGADDNEGQARDGEGRAFVEKTDGTEDETEHPLIPAKRVNGAAVYNQAGEQIGKIEDIAIDKRSGKVAYAILSFGGFLGLGGKNQPLPWSALHYDTLRVGYVVDVTEEFLRLAPKLDTSDLSGWDDTPRREEFHAYYAAAGARPYWW